MSRECAAKPAAPGAAVIAGAAVVLALLAGARGARASELDVWGILDVVGTGHSRAFDSNWFNLGDSNFDAYRLRLFVEGPVADGFSIHTQLLFDDATQPRAIGAYLLYAPSPDRDLNLSVGKIPWPIGTWAARTYSNKNPLVGAPLMYQYHSTLRHDDLPANIDTLLGQAGRGQYGVSFNGGSPRRGLPVVYDLCWDIGAALIGSAGRFEYAFGVTNGTPSHMNTVVDDNRGKSYMGRLGVVPIPALRLGVSLCTGAYVPEDPPPVLPAGAKVTDYHQNLVMADATVEAGRFTLIGEAIANVWETPSTGELDLWSYYVEGKVTLWPGLYAAGRWDEMRFGEVTGSSGETVPWDHDVARLEAGLGYRVNKAATVKGVFQRYTQYQVEGGEREPYRSDMFALQLSFTF